MTWRCTHCDEIYDDDQVCVSFEEGRKYDQDQRIEALEAEVERLLNEKARLRAALVDAAAEGNAIARAALDAG